ncbi:histidine triad nucleotide-binding protein [Ammonifex thiophilus]|uniref:Histidine triad nucleotide-binding protein n=1 Tax=Ammonifex thiophilus TaxID=444093 RepID=A0A3D8P7T1_9THEO|nr:histidine triad nucleotide-binding protein [Ammonifex thiophilus]RDV84757.1 histidine triad nucleotide-binding protein [Ammonifex thiophilus]
MEDCVFCRIVRKEIPAAIVYEDEEILGFKDINPVAPIHLLFIPKKHIATFFDLTPEDEALIGRLHRAVVQVAREMKLEEQGFRLVANCQRGGGQLIFHLHYHLIAGRPLNWPPG